MANENSRDPTTPKPQSIPLAKIHDLPGIPLVRQPDKSYGCLLSPSPSPPDRQKSRMPSAA